LITQFGLKNIILSGLPPDAFAAIRPFLRPHRLKLRDVLQEPKRQIQHVDFIEAGVISTRTLASGSILETTMVGYRGVTNISVALGCGQSWYQTTVVVPGTALRIDLSDLHVVMRSHPVIREHLLRHVHAVMVHSAQNALCGLRHEVEERLACWVSLAQDASEARVLPLTHNDLSLILGLRRPSVTGVLNRFEDRGWIRNTRGAIEVRDGAALKQTACGCLRVIDLAYRTAIELCSSAEAFVRPAERVESESSLVG